MRVSSKVVEQIIRPTGLIDPEVEVRPTRHQIDDLLAEIRLREEAGERVLVHDADEEDVRGPDRLPDRVGRPRALPALRDRHARAHPDHPRAAPRRVRRARRRQPPARGPRPARGVARRDPRRRQGRLPARPHGADPDDRPRRAPRQRPRRDVRRQAHRRRSPRRSTRPTAGARSSSPTTRSTASRRRRSCAGVSDIFELLSLGDAPHVPSRRRAARQDRGHDARRDRGARRHARAGDARGGRGAALRVRGQAARRDQVAAPRAARDRRAELPPARHYSATRCQQRISGIDAGVARRYVAA